jgi:ATP-dependent exoDNAse (exonuclease V) beta subunit
LLRIAAGQQDSINETMLTLQLHQMGEAGLCSVAAAIPHNLHALIAAGMSPQEKQYLRQLVLYSLPEAFEKIVQRYELYRCNSESAFLQALFDVIIRFGAKNMPDLNSFLQWWDERGANTEALSAGAGNAVTISTIHKAKGLEYPVIIVPFADWELDAKARSHVWMRCEKPPYNAVSELPLGYAKLMGKSHFAEQYVMERTQTYLDNLNLLYVALTRAKDEMFVYVPIGKNIGTSRISDALQMVFSSLNADDFAPASIVMSDSNVWECGSANLAGVQQVEILRASTADSSILWQNYFTRNSMPRLKVKVYAA